MDSSRDHLAMGGEGQAPAPAPPRRSELLGPRPAPLKVRKDPGKIKKLPSAAPLPPQPQRRQPVIIYTVSPKVVHTTPGDFMSVVQRLTGGAAVPSSSSAPEPPALPSRFDAATGGLLFSPAARLAAFERAAAAARTKSEEDLLGFDGGLATGAAADQRPQTGLFGGILSPGPSSLPWISPSLFTPPSINLFNELSPLQSGGGGRSYPGMSSFAPMIASPNNNFLPSGGAGPAPAAGYWDLFNQHYFDC